jgi:rubrerythrin
MSDVTIIARDEQGQLQYLPNAHHHDFEWHEQIVPPYNHYICRKCGYHWHGDETIPDCEQP